MYGTHYARYTPFVLKNKENIIDMVIKLTPLDTYYDLSTGILGQLEHSLIRDYIIIGI